jgi:hypothetical protein
MKREEKAKPTFVALICGQLRLLGALKQAQYNVTEIYIRVVTMEFGTDCHFVIEYVRKMNETAEEGKPNLRGFNPYPANVEKRVSS